MTPDTLIATIEAGIAKYRAELPPPPPEFRLVRSPSDLQGILGVELLPVHLDPTLVYPGVTLPSKTRLFGNGAHTHGIGKRALYVAPESGDIKARDLICTSDAESVVKLGDDSKVTQGTLAKVPHDIELENVIVPTHRGKRGFEVHASKVALLECQALDVFWPGVKGGGVDSQGLWMHNTPGDLYVRGGRYQGGSECFMTAGDDRQMSDCWTITGLLFEDTVFDRPLDWMGATDVYRQGKNIFELKNACDVIARRCIFREGFKEAQDGYALMMTPTRGGRVTNVLYEDCTVEHAGGFMNVTGVDSSGLCDVHTTGIRWVRGSVNTRRAIYGGGGRTILLTGGVGTVDIEDTTIRHDGTSLVYTAGPMMERIRLVGSTIDAGVYGLNLAGGANLAKWAVGVLNLTVTGNTIIGADHVLKANLAAIGKLPLNTYA
jgi:hypothetical protein